MHDIKMRSATELQREIQKTKQHLNRLQSELHRVRHGMPGRESRQDRLARVEAEFRKKYPNIEIDRSILKLVGALPNRGSDRKLIAEAIAEKYAE